MDKNIVTIVDRTIATYGSMGLRSDQKRRELLRAQVDEHVRLQFDRGEHDTERLLVLALRHLVSLEARDPRERRRY